MHVPRIAEIAFRLMCLALKLRGHQPCRALNSEFCSATEILLPHGFLGAPLVFFTTFILAARGLQSYKRKSQPLGVYWPKLGLQTYLPSDQ